MHRLILVFTILLSGCVSTQIKSNKAPDFNEKIERLFIMIKGNDSAKPFFISLKSSLYKPLVDREIEVKSHYFDPLSLETEEDILNKVNDFKPNVIMVIQQTESRSTTNQYGWGITTNTGGTFDIKLLQPNSKTPVWRANLKAEASLGLAESAVKASKKLVDRLVADKLLDPLNEE